MDIIAFFVFIICVIFGTLIVFAESIKIIEKAAGVAVFYGIAVIAGGTLFVFSFYVTPMIDTTKTSILEVVSSITLNGTKTTIEKQHCIIHIDQKYPLMVVLGQSAETTYEMPCNKITPDSYQGKEIKRIINSWDTNK